jgi:hypothetical protein
MVKRQNNKRKFEKKQKDKRKLKKKFKFTKKARKPTRPPRSSTSLKEQFHIYTLEIREIELTISMQMQSF